MTTTNLAAGAAALAAVGLLGAGLTGCSGSFKVETGSTPAVSKSSLQQELTDKLTAAGNAPQSVTCKQDLSGEVGKTATCDVVFSDTNSVEAILTTTGLEGETVNFDIAPALNKEQLQKAVAGLASAPNVTCDAGLAGTIGANTNCEVDLNGTVLKRIVTVSGVSGLSMDLDVTPVATKEQVEDMLMERLAAEAGGPPDSVACADDVIAKAGNTVECVVSAAGTDQNFLVTVTDVDGDTVNFDFAAQP